jgi:hypothetical protein
MNLGRTSNHFPHFTLVDVQWHSLGNEVRESTIACFPRLKGIATSAALVALGKHQHETEIAKIQACALACPGFRIQARVPRIVSLSPLHLSLHCPTVFAVHRVRSLDWSMGREVAWSLLTLGLF